MKNIINWTLGGFFRSIGRILSFIVIGGLIAFLIAKSGFKIPDFMKPLVVHAEVLENWSSSESRIRWDQQGTPTLTSWETTPHTWSPTYPVDLLQYRVKATNGLDSQNTYVLKFGYKPTPQAITPINIIFRKGTQTTTNEDIVCGSWSYNSNGYNIVSCSFTPKESYTSSDILTINVYFNGGYITDIRSYMYGFEERKSTNAVITDTGNQIIINIEEQTTVIENAIENSTTNIIEGLKEQNMVCQKVTYTLANTTNYTNGYLNASGVFTAHATWKTSDYLETSGSQTTIYNASTSGEIPSICFYKEDKTLINCTQYNNRTSITITNPELAKYFKASFTLNNNTIVTTGICKNGNQAINDILSDIDTSNDSSALSDFFHNLGLNTEQPLASIINLPINMLRTLLVDYNATTSHADLCTTFAGQNICLPSGDILWKRSGCHDNAPFGCPNYSTFKTFFQLVVGGFIYWNLLKRLVKTAEKGLDPQQSGVNLMKL